MHQEKLLREYVKRVLTEDIGDYGGGGDATSPYGYAWGSNEDLYNTFVGPFVDVFKTAAGKSKEIGQRAKTALWVGLQSILTTLIPIYGYNYAEVFDKEKEKIDKIRSEYQDVYDRTGKALGGSDAAMLAFMANPGVVLSLWAGSKAPKVTKGILSAATGGISDDVYDGIKNAAVSAGRWSLGGSGSSSSREYGSDKSKKKKSPKDFDFSSIGESQDLSEDASETKPDITPEKILKSKKFLSKALEAPKLKEMQQVATKIYRESLKEIYKQAEDLLKNAKTVEDLEKISKKPIKDIDKVKSLKGEEKAKAEKMLIDGVRKNMKEFYIKSLSQQVETVRKAGVPEESQYIKDFKEVIQKIKAL